MISSLNRNSESLKLAQRCCRYRLIGRRSPAGRARSGTTASRRTSGRPGLWPGFRPARAAWRTRNSAMPRDVRRDVERQACSVGFILVRCTISSKVGKIVTTCCSRYRPIASNCSRPNPIGSIRPWHRRSRIRKVDAQPLAVGHRLFVGSRRQVVLTPAGGGGTILAQKMLAHEKAALGRARCRPACWSGEEVAWPRTPARFESAGNPRAQTPAAAAGTP